MNQRKTQSFLRMGMIAAAAMVGFVGLGLAGAAFFWPRVKPKRPGMPVVQVDPETSCGPVSLAVASLYLNRQVPIQRFQEATRAGSTGICSMADLQRAIAEVGLSGAAVRYACAEPPPHGLPMILFVDGQHFLVALPAGKAHTVIVDPPAEPRLVAWSELSGRWKGETLVVARNDAELSAALTMPSPGR